MVPAWPRSRPSSSGRLPRGCGYFTTVATLVSWLACPPLAKVQRRIFGTLSCFLMSDTVQQRFCRATSSNDFVTLPQLDRHIPKTYSTQGGAALWHAVQPQSHESCCAHAHLRLKGWDEASRRDACRKLICLGLLIRLCVSLALRAWACLWEKRSSPCIRASICSTTVGSGSSWRGPRRPRYSP